MLVDGELAEVWQACLDDDYGKIVKLLILTLQRRTEIGDLADSEIDVSEHQILLPEHRTKNGRPHIVPLSDLACEIIESIERRDNRDLLFGRGEGGSRVGARRKSRSMLASQKDDDVLVSIARCPLGHCMISAGQG